MSDENGTVKANPRISPPEVLQAYVDTDMVPRHATMHTVMDTDQFSGVPYAVPQHCGCAIGTLFKQRTGFYHNENPNSEDAHSAYEWGRETYGDAYFNGFVVAFDAFVQAGVPLPTDATRPARYNEGIEDGALVARACYPVVRP